MLLILFIFASCFILAGCQSKVNITDYIIDVESEESFTSSGHVWQVKYYVDPSELDMSAVDKIEIKINGEEFPATVSYEGRLNNYFEVRCVDPDYNWVNLHVDRCVAYVSDGADEEAAGDGEEAGDSGKLSVGGAILIGAIATVVAIFISWLAVASETAMGLNITYALEIIAGLLMIVSYFAIGIWQGVVVTVYVAIFGYVTEGIFKKHYDL